MGWASEAHIEQQNLLMETNDQYAEEQRQMEEDANWYWMETETEKSKDYFEDFRIDHTGYVEVDEPILDAEIIGNLEWSEADLPW